MIWLWILYAVIAVIVGGTCVVLELKDNRSADSVELGGIFLIVGGLWAVVLGFFICFFAAAALGDVLKWLLRPVARRFK